MMHKLDVFIFSTIWGFFSEFLRFFFPLWQKRREFEDFFPTSSSLAIFQQKEPSCC